MARLKLLVDMIGTPDDLFALAAAKASGEVEIVCVSSVQSDALGGEPGAIVGALGLGEQYATGAEKGLLNYNHSSRHREPRWPEGWLGGGRPLTSSSQNAVVMMAAAIERSEGASILALGPLTNVATLLCAHPELKDKIDAIVIKGGSCYGGDALGSVEYNMLHDPEAAHIVFSSGLKLVMVGIDVEPALRLGEADAAGFGQIGGRAPNAIAALLSGGCALSLRGVAAVAALLGESSVELEDQYVQVDLAGRYTRGATASDRLGTLDQPYNTWVAMGADRAALLEQALDALK